MSDDVFESDGGEYNWGSGYATQLLRDSRVTENLDTIFELLSITRLRYVLYYLYSMDDEVAELEDVVHAVCAYEVAGTEPDEPPSREQVKLDVHHSKLPRLDEAGIIDYDSRQNELRFYHSPSLEEWLEHARHMEID
ncbi:DUF7344 domain-containing protein [Haloprofundus salilacus]|uniref:DUF7344 domain-containing protein n=1 Tax=Haloprofundus salilacus TaxID=2876190 RepID=UPI001CCA7658|nr:hypothetical protein [Haloprofundus salilacus]